MLSTHGKNDDDAVFVEVYTYCTVVTARVRIVSLVFY